MTNAVTVAKDKAYVVPFEQLRMTDVEIVGGKNASLGEMISQLAEAGVRVPTGFATTALAFRDLSPFNAIVIGVRAYELRPELAGANQRLLDYVSKGGTLVVQYQTFRRGSCSVWPQTPSENANARPDWR